MNSPENEQKIPTEAAGMLSDAEDTPRSDSRPLDETAPIEPAAPAEAPADPQSVPELQKDTPEAPAEGSLPAYLPPVEEADKVKPRKIEPSRHPNDDYVVPELTFAQHLKDHFASPHTGKTKIASEEEMAAASEGFIYALPPKEAHPSHSRRHHHHHHHHHRSSGSSKSSQGSGSGKKRRRRHRKKKKWVKVVIIIVSILLALVLLGIAVFALLKDIGRRNLHTERNFTIVTPTEPSSHEEIFSVDDTGRTIVYEGKTYYFNDNVVAIAVIGVDNDIENHAVQSMGDSINIAALDIATGKMSIISISRDTMCDVNLYSDEGAYIDTERMQMAYAYSFGNRHLTGGKNTTDALSKLFYGLPITNYFALNMDALTTINDAIGGVTLTSSMTFTSPIDGRTIYEGETVTLHGREVERYVRSRDLEKLTANNERMQRQKEYISAFVSQIYPKIKSDLSLVSDLYNIVKVNSESTLNLPEMTYLATTFATKLGSTSEIEYLSLDGKISKGEYTEFYPDDKSILETMLHVFYTPAEEE